MNLSNGEDRQSDLAVMESNEYKQKRRLRAILDAHDEVEEINREGYHLMVEGEITRDAYCILWLEAVKRLVREVYPLLERYWQGLEAADDVDATHADKYLTKPKLGEIEFRSREPVEFWGLSSIEEAQSTYSEEWVETVPCRYGQDREEKHTATHAVPKRVSVEAFKLVKKFLSEEHDLRVQFEEMGEGRVAVGKYSDILEHGPPDDDPAAWDTPEKGDDSE